MIAAVALVSPEVRAQSGSEGPLGTEAGAPEQHHRGQVGLSLMPGIGYRVIARYHEDQTCLDSSPDDSKWVCTNRVPFFLDLQLSYGLASRLDLIADVRLGIARESALGVGRQLAIAPGLRFWLEDDVRLKFYTTVQGLWDGTTQGQADVPDQDFGLRNSNGLMYDVTRNLGVFFQFGETIGVLRWFRMEVDVGVGIQARLP